MSIKTTLNSYSYTYDPVGNVTGRTENSQTHFNNAKPGIWSDVPVERGRQIEDKLGGMRDVLGDNFKTIDKFEAGIGAAKSVTSIKSIDPALSSFNVRNNFYTKLRGYVDSLEKFTTHTQNKVNVIVDQNTKKYLEIALPCTTNESTGSTTRTSNSLWGE